LKEFIRNAAIALLARLLEAQSSPYSFSDRPALFVAPHADDESLGGAGLLLGRARRHLTTTVVFLSDSGAPHSSYGPLNRQGVAERRQAESLTALAELGVPAGAARFLAATDGALDRLAPEVLDRVHRALVAVLVEQSPAEVFVPYLGGGSTEHDAAHGIVREALAASGVSAVLWEYPVWAWWNPRRLRRQLAHSGENFRLALGASDRERKAAAVGCHVSQAPLLPPGLVRACLGPNEYFFRRTRK
jgi:LmbE family N-acetylglucosaminyl deacetylase